MSVRVKLDGPEDVRSCLRGMRRGRDIIVELPALPSVGDLIVQGEAEYEVRRRWFDASRRTDNSVTLYLVWA